MKNNDLTLLQLRHKNNLDGSFFLEVYTRLITGQSLNEEEKAYLLKIGIIFVGSSDKNIEKLGYRIILHYSNRFLDYAPLYDIALGRNYIPIVGYLERKGLKDLKEGSFSEAYLSSFKENFRVKGVGEDTYRSGGQLILAEFAKQNSNIAVVAPTSYGKSEMLIEKVRSNPNQNICIIVPTKALLAQTKKSLLGDAGVKKNTPQIITHPDMYRDGLSPFIAVLTQERLLRLLQKNPKLAFDRILVDEAHNILDNDERARLLAQVLLIAQKRNANLDASFFTPFLADPTSIEIVNRSQKMHGKKIDEYMKVEAFYLVDMSKKEVMLYDQFLDRFFVLGVTKAADEIKFIIKNSSKKNVVYLNQPRQAEGVALRIAEQRSSIENDDLKNIVKAIGKLIHPEYNLIKCIERGVLYHHGKLPDVVRLYVEDLFSKNSDFQFLASTSTLLEGVNTPADRMFLLSPKKGRGNLKPAQFKNLVGRVSRFREVFNVDTGNLGLLEPKIFLLDGVYCPDNFNSVSFYRRVANVGHLINDDIKNPLLEHRPADEEREEALHYLENIEPGASGEKDVKTAATEIGRLCFANSLYHFDILASEKLLDQNLSAFTDLYGSTITDSVQLVEAVCQIFLVGLDLSKSKDKDNLERLRDNAPAQRFYSMFLQWRVKGMSYGEMIARFLAHWDRSGQDLIYVGTTWGELTRNGHNRLWVDLSKKSVKDPIPRTLLLKLVAA